MSAEMDFCTETKIIYVKIINEIIDVWRPVNAKNINDNHFKIESNQVVAEGEEWEFAPGSVVVCKEKPGESEPIIIATELLEKPK